MQKSLFWKVKEPLLERESGTFVFSLCGEYFSFTFVNCFTELKFLRFCVKSRGILSYNSSHKIANIANEYDREHSTLPSFNGKLGE